MVRLDMGSLTENVTSTTCFVWPKAGLDTPEAGQQAGGQSVCGGVGGLRK